MQRTGVEQVVFCILKCTEDDGLKGNVYYYNCTVHSGMGNSITIENSVSAAFARLQFNSFRCNSIINC